MESQQDLSRESLTDRVDAGWDRGCSHLRHHAIDFLSKRLSEEFAPEIPSPSRSADAFCRRAARRVPCCRWQPASSDPSPGRRTGQERHDPTHVTTWRKLGDASPTAPLRCPAPDFRYSVRAGAPSIDPHAAGDILLKPFNFGTAELNHPVSSLSFGMRVEGLKECLIKPFSVPLPVRLASS